MSSEEIFEAIAAGEMERVRDMVAQDASCAGARNEQGISALMWALYNRRSDMADVVLDAASGVDLFEAAALERTKTLSELAFFGHAEAVTLLLQQGLRQAWRQRTPPWCIRSTVRPPVGRPKLSRRCCVEEQM